MKTFHFSRIPVLAALICGLLVLSMATNADQNRAGIWSGTTSQDQEIYFEFVEDALLVLKVGWVIETSSCSTTDLTQTAFCVNCPQVPVATGDRFSVSAAEDDFSYTIEGKFTSTHSISGTAQFFYSPLSSSECGGTASATWSATRSGIVPKVVDEEITVVEPASWGQIKSQSR